MSLRTPRGGSYTVGKGDNWNTIAARYGTTLAALRALNGGSLNALHIGQTVYVRGAAPARPPTPSPAPAKAPAASGGPLSTSCNGQVGAVTCTAANRGVVTGGTVVGVAAERNAAQLRQAAADAAAMRYHATGLAEKLGMSRPTLVDLAVAEKISDTSWNLGRVASKLKWLGRGAAVLSGVIGAGDVYSATGSVWRAAGAGILNAGAAYLLGLGATAVIGALGLPVLGAAAVVVGAAALGVVLGNVINAQFKKE